MTTKVSRIKDSLRTLSTDAETVDQFETEYKRKQWELEKLRGGRRVEDEKDSTQKSKIDPDENIESYYNYCVKTTSVMYLPVVCLIIWQFYDETAFSAKWSIKQKDFLFYFLFSVIIIPFQIVIDIFSYNIMTYYLNYDYAVCLTKWRNGS